MQSRAGLAAAALLLLGVGCALGCGPLGPVPGGRLSGTVSPLPPGDWSSADGEKTIQLETRPADPYSVNVWGAGVGDHFYLASGEGGDSAWARNIAADPNVRLRIGDSIYELRAVRVEDPEAQARFREAVKRKYDWDPSDEERESAWLYRLDPR